MADNIIEMTPGKIYFVSYGNGTELIVRYRSSDTCNHYCFDSLHYWNGYESFNKSDYFVKSHIEEIREATKAEKHSLIRYAIEHSTI